MAIPRVFLSSTCYDLKYIRENLKYFIRTIGYDPVLSEDGDVFYNPSNHTHDACLREVETCQLFVLIIGGRYGGSYKDSDMSITNSEYRQAIKNNIPVFALVESLVLSDHHMFITNKKEKPKIYNEICYPSCDNIKIFDFLDDVRKNTKNNSLFPFRDFSDIEHYLKKQWAGMMFEFLDLRQRDSHTAVTNRLLDDLALATRKSEELIKILLKASSNTDAEAEIQKVDKKVTAENFARLVLSEFKISCLSKTTINELKGIPLKGEWEEFLLQTNDFYSDDIGLTDNEKAFDIVIWGDSGAGKAYASEDSRGARTRNHFPELEKAYRALKEADQETRNNVFRILVTGA